MEIDVQNVTHVYNAGTPFEHTALSNIELKIDSGTFAAMIGATGSGKSTLIQLISGLIVPTSGRIRVGDWEIGPETKDFSELRGRVGVVFQYPEHQLFEETVAKDIAFGPTNLGLSPSKVKERVRHAMEWVGLSEKLASRSPFHLSGGQMRRVAVAGVLAMEPDILVLDEPTAGLDPVGQRELLNRIRDLHQKRRITVILVSHSMEEAARYADQLFVLNRGKKVLDGSPASVFATGEQKLAQWGLEVPEAVQLATRLNERLNPPLANDVLTLEDLEKEIVACWKGDSC